MALKINITVPGDGLLLIPLWQGLEAQAALSIAIHGSTENNAILYFVAQQFREAFPPWEGVVLGTTASWEDVWRAGGEL